MKDEGVFEKTSKKNIEMIAAVLDGDVAMDVKANECKDGGEVEEEFDCTVQNGETQNQDAQTENKGESGDEKVNNNKYGKFKNPQELLRAYGELEKEFTRRSQRLKELESAKRTPKSEEEWKCEVDKFFEEVPTAKAFAKDIANEIIRNPHLKEQDNCLNIALERVLLDKFRTPEQLMQDGQFLKDYVFSSERVKNAIIADYLDGVREGMPPHTLISGGMQCVAPKVKPKTIEEAGFMFLKNNK